MELIDSSYFILYWCILSKNNIISKKQLFWLDSNTKWIVLRGLCVHTDSYNPSHIMTAPECTRRCEAEPGCVMAKFSSAASLCWLSKSRKMAPLGNGCDGKFKNIYDYFVKRTSVVNNSLEQY
jgi:hypothetical protein